MRATVRSAGVLGMDAYTVEIEVEVAFGLPSYHVVGLPACAVKEGGVRVRSALEHAGHKLKPRRVLINMAPGDVRKDGAAYDLPTAVALLVAEEVVPQAALDGVVLLGELSLDGRLRRVAGTLPIAMHARACGARALVLPAECAGEAAAVSGLPVHGARTRAEVGGFLGGELARPRAH